ncbi:TolC family protein [Zhouia sp. PK063]|uniref:TolC family protein n=1 Tax=Zhouia sp. PK063 TaxID=3373602 RepID=UPI0037A6E890
MKKLITVLFLIAAFAAKAQDQASYTFSLDQAINYALQHNRQSINASRDIDAAIKQKWETTASGLPQISGSASYQNNLKQQVSLIPAEFFGGEPGTFQAVKFGTKQNMTATATINQLLFDGSYIVGLQSAKVYLAISKNAKTKTDLQIREAVVNAYGNVLMAEESINILNKNLKVLKDNLFETQKTYENGLTEEENVEQLKITLANVQSNFDNTTRLRDIAYKMLNITLGLDIDAQTTLTDDLDELTIKNIDFSTNINGFDIENNIDYKIAKNNEISQELLLKLEKSKALPSLSAFINGGYQAYSEEFDFFDKGQKWFGSSVFGVNLSIPIFSSLARSARTKRAAIEVEKAKTELTETEQQLQLQLEKAQSEYQFAIEQYQTAKENLKLAERIEHKNQVKFSEGIASSFDLRQAQTQLYDTQSSYLQSMLDVINKKAALESLLNPEQVLNNYQQ